MKIIIPVAGIGTKLRPHTHTQPKTLVPVAGNPILAHIIDYFVHAGYDEFVFIIGYLGNKIEEFVKTKYPDMKTSFVVQEPREGSGHAVWCAKDFVHAKDEILIVLGDTIIDFDIALFRHAKHSLLGVKKVDDPRNFGVVELNDEGFVSRVYEKPIIPKSNLALVGIYFIKEAGKLFNAIDYFIANKIKTRNEYHLTDGIMRMIEEGEKTGVFQVGNWFDCGSKDSLLETNATLLDRLEDAEKKLQEFPNTIIIPPVSIAYNCDIADSIIGPHVSIGENSIVKKSIIKDSIIVYYSQLESAVLHHSVVGSDSYLKGLSQSLNIGDSTEIDFS